jgi:hypothetical protein
VTSPTQQEPPDAKPPGERLQLDPYSGPRSHHASRAFADMIAARHEAKRRRKKIALLLLGAVLGALFALFIFSLLPFR